MKRFFKTGFLVLMLVECTSCCRMMHPMMMSMDGHYCSRMKKGQEFRDPVCGAIADRDSRFTVEYNGHTYYFDSEECKKVFQKNPDRFVSATHRHLSRWWIGGLVMAGMMTLMLSVMFTGGPYR